MVVSSVMTEWGLEMSTGAATASEQYYKSNKVEKLSMDEVLLVATHIIHKSSHKAIIDGGLQVKNSQAFTCQGSKSGHDFIFASVSNL